jgi:EAL domain-containing protein (putative c-di-GMP-specific phosphodiesterase class I)
LFYKEGGISMAESIRTYHDHLPDLEQELSQNGSLGMILLDVSPFGAIEERYGTRTYASVRRELFDLLVELSGKEYRKEDILALEEPAGLRILLFLSPQRQAAGNSHKSLVTLRARLKESLIPKLLRTSLPYLKTPTYISMGYSLGIHNPLIESHHTILRMIREAFDCARLHHLTEEMENLQRLRELILNEEVLTYYQPIVGIRDGKPVAYEALSRGNAGTMFHSAGQLFNAADKHQLLVELDRLCRKKALLSSNRIPTTTKLFVNTLPATILDPEFQGGHLISLLEGAGITPNRIVVEITERLVIDNLSIFQDEITYFTNLGMSLAVDDVGAGYSGLETIARLKPSYLKVDMSLVRNIHTSRINREILKAILSLGHGIGAKVIAEGIEIPEELLTLRTIGVDYGQGFLLGKPSMMSA